MSTSISSEKGKVCLTVQKWESLWGRKRAAIATVYDQYRVQITSALIGLTDIVLFQRSAHRKIYKLSLTGNNLPLESCIACKLVSACLSGPPLAAPSAALHEAR